MLSAVLHGAVILALWLAADADRAEIAGNRRPALGSVSNRGQASAAGDIGSSKTVMTAVAHPAGVSVYDAPIDWLGPAFAANAFGLPIDVRSGRILRVDKKLAPDLKKPRFIHYLPPRIEMRQPDPDLDVLSRTRPVTYTRESLEREEAELKRDIAADLRDCRLDEMPLEVVILRSRYLRLRKILFEKGLEPDFSYSELRNHFLEKLYRIRRSLEGVPAEHYFDTLLFQYRKNKIYEEKRGHSLLNAIFYDFYNCRTGTEELAIYFSLFHPKMALGINRGSIVKFDGTLIGHVDPAVRINGEWTVFKTVSRVTEAVTPYKIGELFPIEKLILDYLPGFDAATCRLNRPLARNGEELDDAFNARSDKLHPLIVKHDDSRIILLRETVAQPETFPMISREDRLFSEMINRYYGISGGKGLLHPDQPYLDFIFHLKAAPDEDRKALIDLYLKNRIDTAPTVSKRPLRAPGVLPGYQDLVRTLFSEKPEPELEIVPGTAVPTRRYQPHKIYIEDHNRAIEAMTAPRRSIEKKAVLPGEIARFLLFFNNRGTALVRPPAFDPDRLVRDLVNDRYDLSPFMESEPARRKSGTSSRRIAILKVGLAGDDRMVRSILEKRTGQLAAVLGHGHVNFENVKEREANEIPGAISYGETIRQRGKTGLSPGFVKDMVEMMGETGALSAFSDYLALPALQPSRAAMAEMLGYMDRYLLLGSSRQRLKELARGLFADRRDSVAGAAAAQFLVRKGAVSSDAANDVYERYFKSDRADVTAVGALLNAGLDRERASLHFRGEIDDVDLNATGAHQRLDTLGRIARLLQDPDAQRRIVDKHEAFVEAFFDSAPHDAPTGALTPGNALNSLSYLARQMAGTGDERIFGRLVTMGANDFAVLLLGEPVEQWLGDKRYRAAMTAAQDHEKARFSALRKDLVRLRGKGGLPSYGAALAGVRSSAARMTFLAALNFQNGRRSNAYGSQADLLHGLFSLEEFQQGFEKKYGTARALERDRALNHESIHRAVELTGFLSREMNAPGVFDLNHAPFIKMVGDYRTACGPTRRTINSRSAPNNISFTSAGTYFASLLNPDNSPQQVAAAFKKEQELLRTLSSSPLKPARAADMDETQVFFRGMDQSAPCDIRRVYVFEKLLRQSALPERLPAWILALAKDSHGQEMAFWDRMESAGGPPAVIEDFRRMEKGAFDRKWGETPFSLRNLYGTLLLVKTGHLEVGAAGAFRPTVKFDR